MNFGSIRFPFRQDLPEGVRRVYDLLFRCGSACLLSGNRAVQTSSLPQVGEAVSPRERRLICEVDMVANKSDAASRSRRRDRLSFLTPPSQIGLMLGYCRMKEEAIREGVRRLAEIL
ncbi:MAG: hypothetical protein WAK48_06940 [Candidatus Acidiferrum sp.]|jgi:hypothetical protein